LASVSNRSTKEPTKSTCEAGYRKRCLAHGPAAATSCSVPRPIFCFPFCSPSGIPRSPPSLHVGRRMVLGWGWGCTSRFRNGLPLEQDLGVIQVGMHARVGRWRILHGTAHVLNEQDSAQMHPINQALDRDRQSSPCVCYATAVDAALSLFTTWVNQ